MKHTHVSHGGIVEYPEGSKFFERQGRQKSDQYMPSLNIGFQPELACGLSEDDSAAAGKPDTFGLARDGEGGDGRRPPPLVSGQPDLHDRDSRPTRGGLFQT